MLSETGLATADLIVLSSYLIGITLLGLYMGRGISSSSDFFMPRRFGKAMMITHAFGTGTASDQAVLVAGQTFKSGFSGIWWQWIWLPATPFYWIVAAIMRRFRAVTTADVYALRYDRSVASLFALVGIVGLAVKIGLLLKGSAALVDSCTSGLVSSNTAIAIITVLFVAYGSAGGLGAAIVTDFVQGVLTIVFSFILLPITLNAVGGLEGIREAIHDPQMLSVVSQGDIGVFFIAMFSLQALVGVVAQPFIMGVCGAGRTELDGRIGFMVGNICKRFCTVAWSMTAMAALAWYIGRGVDPLTIEPDYVYGDVARAFLPGILPGLLGLFMASLLASVMSSCDSFMISSAALFTENIYRHFRPQENQEHYLKVGRIASLLVVASGLGFAYWVPNVKTALSIWFKIAPMMGIALWVGFVWRRSTVAGAWATAITGFACWWLSGRRWCVDLLADTSAAERLKLFREVNGELEIYEPWVIAFYITAAAFAGIVVSLLSKPVADQQLDRFYGLMYTPVEAGETITESCRLPEGVSSNKRTMWIDKAGIQVPVPSRISVVGFLLGWLMVLAVVGVYVLVVRN